MVGTDRKHGTLDHTNDDKANGLGSNLPEHIFLLKKGTKSNICHRWKELSNDRCDLARRQITVLNIC